MSRKTGQRLTQDERNRIIGLAKEGKTIVEMVKVTGVSVATICKIKKDAGLGRAKGAGRPRLGYDEIRAKYQAAVKDAELWKARLAEALVEQEKKLEKDRKELGI